MTSVIADILKSKLANLIWIERFGGMVSEATKPHIITVDGKQVTDGYETYPVACGVNVANCWENGAFKYFEPDSKKSAIAFFVDNGGISLRTVRPPKDYGLEFEFSIKFLCWMNSHRLGDGITDGSCLPSGRIAPYVIAQLFGHHSAVGLFGGALEEDVFQAVEVTSIRELTKNPSMFEPFTFARDGANRGLFIYPYDYFGLQIQGTFVINRHCLPPLGEDYTPFTGCVTPADNSNWFDKQMQTWLASRPAYISNDAADIDLALHETYWADNGNIQTAAGSFMRVV